MEKITLSALDLAVVREGGNAAEAIARTVALAQHIEALQYKRIWLAEHHNMANIASSATAVLIGHVAGHTTTLRVGSGGIMLPNHSPLVIAEQFGTLEILYPKRIDLGLGRAPGTDQVTAAALRRNYADGAYNFGRSIEELQQYLGNTSEHARVRAFPGEGTDIPIWVLGSSTDSAFLAAEMGLPYAFAAHFAPAQFRHAVDIYKKNFSPSPYLQQPYMMACVNVIGADTNAEAAYQATSMYRMFLGIITNQRKGLQPPVETMDGLWGLQERAAVAQMTACTFIGNRETLREKLLPFIEETGIDELMVTSNIYDTEKRLHSYAVLKEAMEA
ncbi:LLM class flavin-dependent oxidoreductase [Taibaiella koreensis]|uniref:LLM class flavin-dependent oxidoreductase n=1 Tax=Taibaiella koreensis TaxID=1268548 RepID=UPI000E59FD71|nr:LLM class flavin-dependent oxidoreductase [Taibaiella koreensis]